jgi:hypothetical protein
MDIFLETDEHRERIESMSSAYLDLDLVDRMLDLGIEWCKDYFQQDWANLNEFSEVPTEYHNGIYGYRVVVVTTDYPRGTWIDVLVAPDGSLSAIHIEDSFIDESRYDSDTKERISNKSLSLISPAYSHITHMAEQWSKEYFAQDQVQIVRIYQRPKEYPDGVYGYQIEIMLPKQAQREIVHVLLAPDGSLSAKHVGSAPLP